MAKIEAESKLEFRVPSSDEFVSSIRPTVDRQKRWNLPFKLILEVSDAEISNVILKSGGMSVATNRDGPNSWQIHVIWRVEATQSGIIDIEAETETKLLEN